MKVALYQRVSTGRQAESGLGLDAQREQMYAECERRGWTVSGTFTDRGVTAKTMEKRPALAKAIAAVEGGDAEVLMVAKLDRLSRSLLDFASLMDRSQSRGWGIVALDLGVDSTTPAGEMMAAVVAAFAQYERRLISQRTRDALAAARGRGTKLGRPRTLSDAIVMRIASERAAGRTLQEIANSLAADGVPTARGGSWRPGTVSKVIRSVQKDDNL